jgi:hypothetical protein
MKRFFQLSWDAVRRAVLPWIHRERFTTLRVEELPSSLKGRRLYLIGDRQPWAAALLCPCGCGEVIQLSLLQRDSPRWNIAFDRDHFPTLAPSVWRTRGCGSHFFIRRGSIVWCQAGEPELTNLR